MFAAVVTGEIGDTGDNHPCFQAAAFLHNRHIHAFRVVADEDHPTEPMRAADGTAGVVEHFAGGIAAARDHQVCGRLNLHNHLLERYIGQEMEPRRLSVCEAEKQRGAIAVETPL
ncbi:MAG: hypothetical protein HND48_04170 [Chloroflexi bacterium]|nr:hypothetical protein [Chloroflexota bacterium]